MLRMARRCWGSRNGSNSIEYTLIGALVSVAIVGGLMLLAPRLNAIFNAVAGKFPS